MYHPMVEALALTLVDVPFTLVTIILFTIIVYFIVDLQRSAAQFLYVSFSFSMLTESSLTVDFFSIYFLSILVVTLSMKAFFRGLAAAFKGAAPAQAVAGVLLLALSLYTGYQIPKPSMIGALRWISDINVGFSKFYYKQF